MKPKGLPTNGFWIYLIVNSINGKIYVGKTKRPYHRCHQYLYDFENRNLGHINDHLFNAFSKYGINNFHMILWEKCENDIHTAQRELFWIDQFNTTNRKKGYNLRRDSQTGMIVHRETSDKISNRLKAEWKNGIRKEHSQKLKDKWEENPERKKQQAELFRKYKTKWEYLLYFSDFPLLVDYQTLKIFGLHNAIANFHRDKSDTVHHKGWKITRVRKINGSPI